MRTTGLKALGIASKVDHTFVGKTGPTLLWRKYENSLLQRLPPSDQQPTWANAGQDSQLNWARMAPNTLTTAGCYGYREILLRSQNLQGFN